MKEVTLKEAVDKICTDLKSDEDYYRAWQANIAVSFQDKYWTIYNRDRFSDNEVKEIHKISNDAAKSFLDMLIKL